MTPYTLTHQRGDLLLRFPLDLPMPDLERGSKIARSLGARYARGYVGFILSESNARKFSALYDAGFSAYRCNRHSEWVWRYGRSDEECRRLPDAVKAAQPVEAVCVP